MRGFGKSVVAVLSVALTAAAAQAAAIGININGGGTYDGTTGGLVTPNAADNLGPADVTGAVPQANWNNMALDNSDGGGNSNGSLSTVMDSTGAVLTGVTVALGGGTTGGAAHPATGADWGMTGTDLTMVSSGTNWSPNIVISGIPYQSYDVYVYLGTGGDGGGSNASFTLSGTGGTVNPNTYYVAFCWPKGVFTAPNFTTQADADANNVSDAVGDNMVYFSGNTASDLTVNMTMGTVQPYRLFIGGIQIVDTSPVPEPASLGLLGLGAVALLRRRR